MTKEEVLRVLQENKHAVIATSDATGKPESALIGFGQTDNLEIIFGTYRTSRKYKNLKENPVAAVVVGWGSDNVTVQYEGTVRELSEEEIERYISLYHEKVPSAIAFRNHPDQSYWLVSPRWIRYSDLNGEEDRIRNSIFSAGGATRTLTTV